MDDRKTAVYNMMEKLNVLAVDSTQFLQFVALKVMEIDQNPTGLDIEELC